MIFSFTNFIEINPKKQSLKNFLQKILNSGQLRCENGLECKIINFNLLLDKYGN